MAYGTAQRGVALTIFSPSQLQTVSASGRRFADEPDTYDADLPASHQTKNRLASYTNPRGHPAVVHRIRAERDRIEL